MPCINCGHIVTIRAHLLPQVFCKEVQIGKAHATSVFENGSFHPSQSGTFDPDILCANCDNKLGILENYASKVLADIRQDAVGKADGIHITPPILSKNILRFCAGILWKYSITKNNFGRIKLGPYQEKIRKIALGEADICALATPKKSFLYSISCSAAIRVVAKFIPIKFNLLQKNERNYRDILTFAYFL